MSFVSLGITELLEADEEQVLKTLLSAYQTVRDIQAEMKTDYNIRSAKKALDEAQAPFRKRILQQKSIIASAELVARGKGFLKTLEKFRLEQEGDV